VANRSTEVDGSFSDRDERDTGELPLPKAWSFLSLEKTARLGTSQPAYPDELGVRYAYDTRVPHHAHVRVGDLAVVRDDKWVLGAGWIDYIQVAPAVKIIQRCPQCHRARDYKLRYKEWPPYRCAACLALFEETEKIMVDVQSYTADYSRTFRLVDGYFPASELNPAYLNRSVMTSIRQLDLAVLRPLLREHLAASDIWWRTDRPDPAGGYKPTTGRTRVGQQHFREEMLARFGAICAFTGQQPPEALEAAHLYAYSKTPHHDLQGGLLLRRDLHALFDRELLTIDPADWTIDVAVVLDRYPEISALRGKSLQIPVELRPRKAYIEDHAKRTRAGWQPR
jgi:hypothetical protein